VNIGLLVLLGAAIGAILGALGGGGAILTVPALVYLVHQSPQNATTGSLIIVGATALTAVISHAHAGNVRWRIGLSFALAGVGGAIGGTALNHLVPGHVLILSCAGLLLICGALMLRRKRTTEQPPENLADRPMSTRALTRTLSAGLVVGFLTGFLGVGGGFVIVPALVVAVGLPMNSAVGTSLLIIAANCATSLAARTGISHIDWKIILPFAISAMVAALAGRRIASALPQRAVTHAFAALVLAVAGYMAVHTLAFAA